jgi:hypothetical protein
MVDGDDDAPFACGDVEVFLAVSRLHVPDSGGDDAVDLTAAFVDLYSGCDDGTAAFLVASVVHPGYGGFWVERAVDPTDRSAPSLDAFQFFASRSSRSQRDRQRV